MEREFGKFLDWWWWWIVLAGAWGGAWGRGWWGVRGYAWCVTWWSARQWARCARWSAWWGTGQCACRVYLVGSRKVLVNDVNSTLYLHRVIISFHTACPQSHFLEFLDDGLEQKRLTKCIRQVAVAIALNEIVGEFSAAKVEVLRVRLLSHKSTVKF